VVKSHGSSDARGFSNAIKLAANLARSGYAAEASAKITQLETALHAEHQPAKAEIKA
jgi:glycerol-3-phosphate acyltransferase PlsX